MLTTFFGAVSRKHLAGALPRDGQEGLLCDVRPPSAERLDHYEHQASWTQVQPHSPHHPGGVRAPLPVHGMSTTAQVACARRWAALSHAPQLDTSSALGVSSTRATGAFFAVARRVLTCGRRRTSGNQGPRVYDKFFTNTRATVGPILRAGRHGHRPHPGAYQSRRSLLHRYVPGDATPRLHAHVRAHARPQEHQGPAQHGLSRDRAAHSASAHDLYRSHRRILRLPLRQAPLSVAQVRVRDLHKRSTGGAGHHYRTNTPSQSHRFMAYGRRFENTVGPVSTREGDRIPVPVLRTCAVPQNAALPSTQRGASWPAGEYSTTTWISRRAA